MRNQPLRIGFGVLLCVALAVMWASPAQAHAWLLEGQPGPNQHVTTPPRVLFLRFTEDVERTYTRAEVLDLNGTRVDDGTVRFFDDQRNQILVPLTSIADGVYTVRWFTLSVDTHTASGSYVFAVGNASLAGAPPPQAGHDHAGTGSHELAAGARATYYAGLLLAAGLPVYLLWVEPNTTLAKPNRRHHVLAAGALAGAAGSAGAFLVLFDFSARIELSLGASVLDTRTGFLLGLRLLFLLMAAACFAWALRRRGRPFVIAAGTLGLAAIVATSLSSHAASLSDRRVLAIAADLAHLLAAAVWTGGLAGLLLTLASRSRRENARVILRFSPLAMTSVGLILLTGGLAGLLHLKAPSDLWTTTYGLALCAKILLVMFAASLGALNRLWIGPRLAGGQVPARHLARTVGLEVFLIAGVLVAAGILTSASPPKALDVAPSQPQGLVFERSLKTLHVVFTVSPLPVRVGLQNFTTELHPLQAAEPPAGTEVYLKFQPPGTPEPDAVVLMNRLGPTTWTLGGGYLTERGPWTLYLLVQTRDEFAKLPFEVRVE